MANIPHPDSLITNPKQAVSELALALMSQESLVNILFSDSRASVLVSRLESELKGKIYSQYPAYKNNLEWNVLLTVLIQGNFHAFLSYSKEALAKAPNDGALILLDAWLPWDSINGREVLGLVSRVHIPSEAFEATIRTHASSILNIQKLI